MSLSHGTSIVRDGLVCHLDAANPKSYSGAGATWNDLSGNGYNGTLVGGATFDNNSISLGSVANITNYVSIPETILTGVTAWTMEFWMQRDAANTLSPLISCGGGNEGLILFDGTLISLYNTTNTSITFDVAPIGTPMLVTVTSASASWEAFRDGVSQGTQSVVTSTITPNTSIGLVLGQEMDSATGTFDSTQSLLGRYFSVKIYNRVLTAAEINQNFEATRGRYGI